jgi:hypothetical protein
MSETSVKETGLGRLLPLHMKLPPVLSHADVTNLPVTFCMRACPHNATYCVMMPYSLAGG